MSATYQNPNLNDPPEKLRTDRLRAVFAPPVLEGGSIPKKRQPNHESISRAEARVETIIHENPAFEAIIAARMDEAALDDPVTLLREDEKLRLVVGDYLLNALPNVPDMPPRVQQNRSDNLKNVIEGYKVSKMTSHEYTAILALSMLDGTFKDDFDPNVVEINERGDMRDGQHRYAATQLLDHLANMSAEA